jgi:hypothetical protein
VLLLLHDLPARLLLLPLLLFALLRLFFLLVAVALCSICDNLLPLALRPKSMLQA